MARMVRCIVLCLLITFAPNCLASSLDHGGQSWSGIESVGTIKNSDFQYIALLQLRLAFDSPVFDTGVIRIGLGYPIAKSLNLWFGYDLLPTQNANTRKFSAEERPWQQFLWEMPVKRPGLVMFRCRLEERMNSKEPGLALRLRQRISLQMRNNKIGDIATPIVSDEIFFNLNHPDWVGHRAINQNRLYAGFDISLSQHRVLQVGYLNQAEFRMNANSMSHIVFLSYLFT